MSSASKAVTAALALTGLAATLLAGHPANGAASAPTLNPLLHASEGWINGAVRAESLRGKVVLVDVFTFACYNCRNVTPNLRALHRDRAGQVVIVGIHSPETPDEKNRSNVVASFKALGVTWPVAIDNSFALWRAYGVDAWPTQLIFDRHGHWRKTVIGDSQDDVVDAEIARLVAEK
jgi:thiol-disulfide isomerase/thioredoxin